MQKQLSLSDEAIRDLNWYYEVELKPGVFTKGNRFINMLPTRKLMDRIDFSGLRVLDIGTMEGMFSVLLSRAGAVVTSYDRLNHSNRIEIIKSVYQAEFEYHTGIPFHKFAQQLLDRETADFDCLIFSGVLYHTIEPGIFLHLVRSLLKNGGVMVFETACAVTSDAALFFNENGRFFNGTNFYLPSTQWLDYFFRILGFQIIDVEYVHPTKENFDGKNVARVAMTCVLHEDSILKESDQWGKKRLAIRELTEFAEIRRDAPIDLSSRLAPDSYQSDLYYSDTPVPSLRLTDLVNSKPCLSREVSKCVMRLEDRLPVAAGARC